MARRAICDGCGKDEGLRQTGDTPEAWLVVRTSNFSAQHDYCSKACAIKGLGGTVPEASLPSESDLPVVQAGARVL